MRKNKQNPFHKYILIFLDTRRLISQENVILKNTISSHFSNFINVIRLKQPFGICFVFGPASWALAIGAPPGSFPDLEIFLKFFIGAFLVRCSACVINDFLDRKFDSQVERTKNRVLAQGKMSPKSAVILITVLMLCAFGVCLSFKNQKLTLEAVLCVPVMIAYPLFKRFTYWPHLMLGLTTCMGEIMGWTISRENFDFSILIPLITATVGWIMFHDIVYAFQVG